MFIFSVECVEIFDLFGAMNRSGILDNRNEKVINNNSVDNFLLYWKIVVYDKNRGFEMVL